jgi:hypothetical protein
MMREGRKRGSKRAWLLAPIVAVLALAGCGGSSPVTSVIDLKSPEVSANGKTGSDVHCGWGAVWLPLEWGDVPAGTNELAIYIGRFKQVKEGSARKLVIPYADLLNRIEPTLHQLPANVLPEGAGWSNLPGSTCPVSARGQRVLVEVLALDRKQTERTLKRGLAIRLTEEALKHPQPIEGPRAAGELTQDTAAIGRLITTYPGPHSLAPSSD